MSAVTAEFVIEKDSREAFFVGVVAADWLDRMVGTDLELLSAELLEITAEDGEDTELAVSLVSVSDEEFTAPDTGDAHAVGLVFFFWLAAGTAGLTYLVHFSLVTTDGQTIVAIVPVEVV